jgi:glycosyltransferase involved in cell wall biosynthesis
MPVFTIFIPTYNRADTLPRTLESISVQQDHDLEVVIVDDGSTDNTAEIVRAWQAKTPFKVKYIYQENQGKIAAHNTMLQHATGELTVLLDSDDLLTEDALIIIRQSWEKASKIPGCAGIESLCADLGNHEILGTTYPEDAMLENYLELRHRHRIKGDKLNAVKTSVLRQFPFPRFPGEKHIPESMVWSRIAHRYRFMHINQVLKLVEYQADGISQGWKDKKSRNPCGYRQYYLEILDDHKAYFPLGKRFSAARRYVYLSALCGIPFQQQWSDIQGKLLYLVSFPFGIGKYTWQKAKGLGAND